MFCVEVGPSGANSFHEAVESFGRADRVSNEADAELQAHLRSADFKMAALTVVWLSVPSSACKLHVPCLCRKLAASTGSRRVNRKTRQPSLSTCSTGMPVQKEDCEAASCTQPLLVCCAFTRSNAFAKASLRRAVWKGPHSFCDLPDATGRSSSSVWQLRV